MDGNIANVHYKMGDFKESTAGHLQALKIDEEIDDKLQLFSDYNNLGNDYSDMGIYPEALRNDLEALKIAEKLEIKKKFALYILILVRLIRIWVISKR